MLCSSSPLYPSDSVLPSVEVPSTKIYVLLFKELKFGNFVLFIWPNNNTLINLLDLNYTAFEDVQPTSCSTG